ncbi:MAG: hypothetical protein ACYC7E_12510 [Armatimonadota bacterium]
MKKRTFDCVEMMHQGAKFVRRQVEGMSLEEEAEYWRQQTEKLKHRQQELVKQRKAS